MLERPSLAPRIAPSSSVVICLTERVSQPVELAQGGTGPGHNGALQDANGTCLIFAWDSQTSGFPARNGAELLPQSDPRHC